MGPLGALTAIVFGSALAIAFGLCGVWIILLIIRADAAEIGTQISRLPLFCALFIALSAVSGAATYGLLKKLPWRWRAQAGMWLAVMVTILLVWWGQ